MTKHPAFQIQQDQFIDSFGLSHGLKHPPKVREKLTGIIVQAASIKWGRRANVRIEVCVELSI
jgi:hypothetical protein